MSDQPKAFKVTKAQLLKMALGCLLLAIVVLAVLHVAGVDLKQAAIDGVARLKQVVEVVVSWARGFGPWVFFSAMAILPAFGFPLLPFTLSAGPIFVPQYGMGWVIVFVTMSIGANLAFSYWMARYALRPLLEGVIRKLGYQLPQVAKENGFSLAVLIRVTPGPPFFVQSYLLGLAEVAFKTYMAVSWVIASAYAVALIVFGDALLHGKGRNAFFSLLMFCGLIVGINWLRRRAQAKKAGQG